jgi:hypothetical protein
MHSAIVVIKIPERSYDTTVQQRWQAFTADVDQMGRSSPDPLDQQTGVSRLAENVWLVNFQQNPAALARLVSVATQFGLTYGILQLDALPQWLPAGFDPKTT